MLIVEEDHYGCKISTYFHLERNVSWIKEKLTDEQLLKLSNTSFGFLLNAQVAQWNLQFVHSVLLRQLSPTKCDDDVEDAMYFNFFGNKVRLGSNEFAIITGMKIDDYRTSLKQVKVGEAAVRFKEYIRRGLVEGEATYEDVKIRFKNMGDDISDDECIAMALLLLYTDVVAKPPRTKIDDEIIQLALVVDEWNKFPWGSISYNETKISARSCIINSSQRKSKTYTIGGFPVVFQVNN